MAFTFNYEDLHKELQNYKPFLCNYSYKNFRGQAVKVVINGYKCGEVCGKSLYFITGYSKDNSSTQGLPRTGVGFYHDLRGAYLADKGSSVYNIIENGACNDVPYNFLGGIKNFGCKMAYAPKSCLKKISIIDDFKSIIEWSNNEMVKYKTKQESRTAVVKKKAALDSLSFKSEFEDILADVENIKITAKSTKSRNTLMVQRTITNPKCRYVGSYIKVEILKEDTKHPNLTGMTLVSSDMLRRQFKYPNSKSKDALNTLKCLALSLSLLK